MIHKKEIFSSKISFVTTCMNRSYSIKKTLIHNIENLKQFNNIEFVLLNYDSHDDLDSYIKENCQKYIEAGILNYYKLQEKVEFFQRSRAKNIAYKLSNGNIIHNVDAEWLMYSPIVDLIRKNFVNGQEKRTLHIGGRGGGIVNYKKHFIDAGGYDERMNVWGFEDSDLFNRLKIGFGFEHIRTTLLPYADNIKTRRDERNKNIPSKFNTDNYKIHQENMNNKQWIVNKNIEWGKSNVLKNFKEEIKT